MTKLSDFPVASATSADFLVGVTAAKTDVRYTPSQLATLIGGGGGGGGGGVTPFAGAVVLDGAANLFAVYNIFDGSHGPYWVNLNLFNVGVLPGFTFTATNYPDTFPNYTTFDWSWPLPGTPLWGYPEIIYGTQGGGSFSGGPANKPTPKLINNLGTLSLTYNLTLTTQSVDDTSLLIETWAQTIPANQASITAEILFYATATPAVSSFILSFATHFNYSVGGFNVYFAFDPGTPASRVYMMPVTAPGGATPLNMAQPGTTYTIDFAALITAALNAGWLTGTDLIGGYEVGFETRQGTGSAVFNRLEWNWSNNAVVLPVTTYYVSFAGNDVTGNGSISAPWASIAKINAAALKPGDSVLFQGGQTFTGAIVCPATGRASQPITFGSYGGGRATIAATTSTGFSSTSQAGIIVRDLIFTGTASTNHGIKFTNSLANNAHLQNIQVINCRVSGFGQNGIFITGTAGFAGYDDVLIEGCETFSCTTIATGGGSAGITVNAPPAYGINAAGSNAAFINLMIINCTAHDNVGCTDTNWTGSGIYASRCLNGLIANCTAYNNGSAATGSSGGPVGIWFADSVHCLIDGCESYSNGTGNTLDGSGFDLDGGCYFCTIRNCYSHDNEGSGLQIYCYNDGTITTSDHCSILNCVSVNDGTGGAGNNNPGGIMIGSEATATQTNVRVAGNSVYQANTAAWGVACYNALNVTGLVTDNTFVVGGSLVHVHNPAASTSLVFSGNRYCGAFNVLWSNITYTSLAAWRLASPQQEIPDQVLSVKAATGLEVATPGNIGWNSAGAATSGSFTLIGGPNGLGSLPVPTLYPLKANTSIALDLCPKGTPTDLGYGMCWFDMTPTDQITSGNVATSTFHMGVHTTSIFVGTGQYTAGTVLPLNFGTFNGDTPAETISFTINADATVTYAKALRGFVVVKAGAPTTSDLTASHWAVFKDSGGAGAVVLAYNDAGTIKTVALT